MPTINLKAGITRTTVQDEISSSESTRKTDLKVNTIGQITINQINEIVKSLFAPVTKFILSSSKNSYVEQTLNAITSTIVFKLSKTFLFIKNESPEESRILNISSTSPRINAISYLLLRGLVEGKLTIKGNTIKLNANGLALKFGLLSDYDPEILGTLDPDTLSQLDFKE